MKSLINKVLDKSIYYSFDATGYTRHENEYFKPIKNTTLGNVLITGGTSGIGLALAQEISTRADVHITGRNSFDGPFQFYKFDSANFDKIDSFVAELPVLDHLVLNAGGMPENYKEVNNIEYQCASQLIGHLKLFLKLHESNKIKKEAKIIITSSGGMLLKKLDIDNLLTTNNYDKVQTYANVKRAQVIMFEEFSKRYPEYTFASMHPGWVSTKAVTEALPGFNKFMNKRLRTPSQGADTLVYLLSEDIETGQFWFDRKIANTHLTGFTKESIEQREKLFSILDTELTR